MKKLLGLVIILVVVLVLFTGKEGNQNQSVKIGGLFGLTGYVAFTAEDSRDGFLMAIEDSGQEVEYVIEDFHSDTTKVVTAAKKLINIDQVDVVVGPEWGEFGEVVSPIADQAKTLFISPWMTSEAKWTESPYYFSASPSERPSMKMMIDYMVGEGVNTIGLVYTNNAWSLENVEIFKEELANVDIEIVSDLKISEGVSDFRTELLSVKNADPDVVYAPFSAGAQFGNFLKQGLELGVSKDFFTPEARGLDGDLRNNFSDYIGTIIYYTSIKHDKSADFNEKFEERFGRIPATRTAAGSYDMTTLVLDAIKSGATSTDEVKDYLIQVEDYNGYSNIINFNERGQLESEPVQLRKIDVVADIDPVIE